MQTPYHQLSLPLFSPLTREKKLQGGWRQLRNVDGLERGLQTNKQTREEKKKNLKRMKGIQTKDRRVSST